MAQEVGGWIQQ